VPAVVCTVLACGYALVHRPEWEASQALMVRDEVMGAAARPGKFQQPDDMKTVQETILELARSRTVLAAALTEVGPAPSQAGVENWPSDAAVVALQGHVKLSPPKGAEFGKTEVFYLNVEAESRERATTLAAAICKQLQIRSQDLRDLKAQSLIAELAKTADLARADLESTTKQLTAIESRVGPDLGELRLLNDLNGGDSPLRRSISDMEHELRDAQQSIEANQELLEVLKASKNDTGALTAAPNRLLESQPVLRRLKDGLVDAQLRTAQLAGNMTDEHPQVMMAKISEQAIAAHVREEIDSAIRGIQVELTLSQDRATALQTQMADARRRLTNLAEMRAEYGNLANERNQRSDILKTVEQQLAEAHASQAAARTASLIAVVDSPVAGDAPVGPGKAMIVLSGMFGGLIVGFGIVFLSVPVVPAVQSIGPDASADEFKPQIHEYPAAALNGKTAGHGFNGHSNGQPVFSGSLTLKQALGKLSR
jgi:uncharacterized protein involved in exopolysaccharide biosynthesis